MSTQQNFLIQMGNTIGKIEGTLAAWTKSQEEHNDRLSKLMEKFDTRIGDVEDEIKGARNKIIGFGIGAGAAGGGILTAILRLLH